jgi:hypothetical protein
VQDRREKEAFHLLTLFQVVYQGTHGNIVLNIPFAHILAKFLQCYFIHRFQAFRVDILFHVLKLEGRKITISLAEATT